MSIETAQQRLQTAESFLNSGQFDQAIPIYQTLTGEPGFSGISWFRMGEIYNEQGNFPHSLQAHRQAFSVEPALASKILPKAIRHHRYIYTQRPQVEILNCPICCGKLVDYSCYNLLTSANFVEGFDPIRVWKQCLECSHLCASLVPENLSSVLASITSAVIQKPVLERLPEIGRILGTLLEYGQFKTALEVGCGAGEMAAVARELELNVTAQDVRPQYVQRIQSLLEIEAMCCDFLELQTQKVFDMVLMGDVLEHFQDPIAGLKKACSLTRSEGIVWISTPNFQSAQTRLLGAKDPMWRVCEHLQYFNFQSLKRAIQDLDLEILDYSLSRQYPGSMEVILRKTNEKSG